MEEELYRLAESEDINGWGWWHKVDAIKKRKFDHDTLIHLLAESLRWIEGLNYRLNNQTKDKELCDGETN